MRGTPQQVIDKYNQLARDSQLSGDRVATENFQQHAEHYVRLLNEAQKEQREAQERRDAQDRERREARGEQPGGGQPSGGQPNGGQPQNHQGGQGGEDMPAAEVIEVTQQPGAETGLVETPESKPQRNRRTRKPKADAKPTPDAAAEAPAETPDAGNQEAAE